MIKGIVQVNYIKYWDNNWGILSVSPIKMQTNNEGEQNKKENYSEPKIDKNGEFTIKGSMPKVIMGDTYNIIAKEVLDEQWGTQYNLIF